MNFTKPGAYFLAETRMYFRFVHTAQMARSDKDLSLRNWNGKHSSSYLTHIKAENIFAAERLLEILVCLLNLVTTTTKDVRYND